MPRFFVDKLKDIISISGEDAAHISRSLRMKPGDSMILCDGNGVDADAVIQSIQQDCILLKVVSRTRSPNEPRLEVTVFQALPKADKLEYVIQKTTELGAAAVQPFVSRYCVSRPKDFDKKAVRLQRIATEAAKQSGRGRIPQVLPLLDLPGVCERISRFDRAILCYEGAQRPLRDALSDVAGWERVAVIVGSEGGFCVQEVDLMEQSGVVPCIMGPRILRCETAPVAAMSALMFAAGEM